MSDQHLDDIGNEHCPDCATRDKQIADLTATNQRLADLVRYKRHDLHNEDLISNEEYAEIVANQGAVNRLEGYDTAKAKFKAERDQLITSLQRAEKEVERLTADLFGTAAVATRHADQYIASLRELRERVSQIHDLATHALAEPPDVNDTSVLVAICTVAEIVLDKLRLVEPKAQDWAGAGWAKYTDSGPDSVEPKPDSEVK